MYKNKINASAMGDPSNSATITLPDGSVVTLPSEQLGDLLGDHSDSSLTGDDDDDSVLQAGDDLLGDAVISSMPDEEGDIFAGDPRKAPKFGGFLKTARTMRNLGPNAAIATKVNPTGATPKAIAARALESVPGAVVSMKSLSPLIINKGMINNAPTRALVPGASFVDTIRRAESTYPGLTYTITQYEPTGGTGSLTFNFNAPIGTTGRLSKTPIILVQLATARQFTIPYSELSFRISAGTNEAGAPVDYRTWSFLLSEALESTFFAFIPFIEVSSSLYPCIIGCDSTSPLSVVVTGVPANTQVRVFCPGQDSAQYQYFKSGFGISAPTSGVSNTIAQR